MLKLVRPLVTPERLYMLALGLSGLAALCSIALNPTERGHLVVSMTGATLGSAIGGISIDTFVISRPKGWVWGRGGRWIIAILLGCVLLSGAVAAAVIAIAGLGSYVVGIAAGCCLTVFNAASSLGLRIQKFKLVYGIRAMGGVALIAGYGWFYVRGDLTGLAWAGAYLFAQALIAAVLTGAIIRSARQARPERRGVSLLGLYDPTPARADRVADLSAMAKLHVGISAQMVTTRLDQVLLARFAGAGPVGVYALAVAALEFAQAGAVVRAQKILTNPEQAATIPPAPPVIRATLPVAACAVAGLAVLGILRSEYHQAWILGLLLLPGAVFAALGKTWSAALLIQRGEVATSVVAVAVAAVAVPTYYVFVSWQGAIGAALAVSGAYALYAGGSLWGLRTRSATTVPARAA